MAKQGQTATNLDGLTSAAKNAGAACPAENDSAGFGHDPRAFAHPEDRRFVFLQELNNAFFLGLAHVGRIRIGILKMRTDLKRDQA